MRWVYKLSQDFLHQGKIRRDCSLNHWQCGKIFARVKFNNYDWKMSTSDSVWEKKKWNPVVGTSMGSRSIPLELSSTVCDWLPFTIVFAVFTQCIFFDNAAVLHNMRSWSKRSQPLYGEKSLRILPDT